MFFVCNILSVSTVFEFATHRNDVFGVETREVTIESRPQVFSEQSKDVINDFINDNIIPDNIRTSLRCVIVQQLENNITSFCETLSPDTFLARAVTGRLGVLVYMHL